MAKIVKIEKREVVGLPVYNISVDGDPTFYADGVLVHNCSEMDQEIFRVEQLSNLFPPSHFSCRSTCLPIMVGETGWQYSDLDPMAPNGVQRADGFCSCHGGVEIYTTDEFIRLYGFDPSQPRESDGRFATGSESRGGGALDLKNAVGLEHVDSRIRSSVEAAIDTVNAEAPHLVEEIRLTGSFAAKDPDRLPDRKGENTSDVDLIIVRRLPTKAADGEKLWETRTKARDALNSLMDTLNKRLTAGSKRPIQAMESDVIEGPKTLVVWKSPDKTFTFDPSEPRDDHGRWAPDTGASGGGSDGEKSKEGAGEKVKKAPPGSQLPKETLDKLVELKCSKYPEADIPADKIKLYPLEGDDINSRPLISWKDSSNKGQYGYTREFHEIQAAEKFARIKEFEPDIEKTRQTMIDNVANGEPGSKDHMAATAAAAIAMTGLRPGNPTSVADNDHFGMVFLEGRHVSIEDGQAKINFVGKSGEANTTTIDHPELVKAFEHYKGQTGDKDRMFPVSLKKVTDAVPVEGMKLKDLRTIKATESARKMIGSLKPPPPLPESDAQAKKLIVATIKKVSEHVSSLLCNSPDVARKEYIHPEVIKQWLEKVGDGRATALAGL